MRPSHCLGIIKIRVQSTLGLMFMFKTSSQEFPLVSYTLGLLLVL